MKLNAKRIEKYSKHIKVNSFNCVDSTNTVAKELAANGCNEGVTIVAAEQTAGRGRLGRTFLSKKGGVYFSIVLKPQILADDTLFITTAAAVAAARAIESVSSKKCEIKWVNDIYINNKKVCGILTEGEFNTNGVLKYAILGVGINLFEPKNSFPSNLPLADSVFHKKDIIVFKNLKKEQLIINFAENFFAFYNNLQKKEFIKEYQERSFLTGKKITYTKDGTTYNAEVIGINDDANLIVKSNEIIQKLSHGEIQIVGMEQPKI